MAKKTKKADITSDVQPEAIEPQLEATPETEVPAEIPAPEIKDPIGDVTDGEAEVSPDAEIETDEAAEAETETEIEAEDGPEPEEDEPVYDPKPRLPAKLERLQKILSQAGVSSRRKAEEMIEQGRVQVNGKVVTELGTKADNGRVTELRNRTIGDDEDLAVAGTAAPLKNQIGELARLLVAENELETPGSLAPIEAKGTFEKRLADLEENVLALDNRLRVASP